MVKDLSDSLLLLAPVSEAESLSQSLPAPAFCQWGEGAAGSALPVIMIMHVFVYCAGHSFYNI